MRFLTYQLDGPRVRATEHGRLAALRDFAAARPAVRGTDSWTGARGRHSAWTLVPLAEAVDASESGGKPSVLASDRGRARRRAGARRCATLGGRP